MKKYIPEILITLLLALVGGSFFLHSDVLNRAVDYFAGGIIFFSFIAAGERVSKWFGRGNYFTGISALCFFLFALHIIR